jgi:(R,R)-butanediol dehydrogenase/meso-butanediol dehydrogenase/diacetyl reductase
VRAVRFHGAGDLRVDEIDPPGPPGPGEVLVRVLACGVCGSDAIEYRQGPVLIHPLDVPHPVTGHLGPLVLGHEFAGEVAAVGPGVEALREGMVVACGAGISCGECVRCLAGRTNLCRRYATIGFHSDGGLAELCLAPARICFEAGALPADAAALAQPMAIAVHAARRGGCDEAETVVVVGAGGVGALIAFVAARWGARVVVCDLEHTRLRLARALGADVVIETTASLSLAERLAHDAIVPDVILEASGSDEGLRQSLASAPRGARVVAVGVQKRPREVDLRRLALDEIELVGTVAHTAATDMPEALRLLSGRTAGWSDLAPVAVPLEEAVPAGIVPLAEGRSRQVKTLVDPWATETRPSLTCPAQPLASPSSTATRPRP